MNIDPRAREVLEKYKSVLKPTDELETILEDMKVLGRREYAILLRMQHKYQAILNSNR